MRNCGICKVRICTCQSEKVFKRKHSPISTEMHSKVSTMSIGGRILKVKTLEESHKRKIKGN